MAFIPRSPIGCGNATELTRIACVDTVKHPEKLRTCFNGTWLLTNYNYEINIHVYSHYLLILDQKSDKLNNFSEKSVQRKFGQK